MEIRFSFELIAVYPEAEIHSQFCIISEPEVGKKMKAIMEARMKQTLPNRFVAKALMEDGSPICVFVDEEGVSVMDEPAVHWWGDTVIEAPEYTVIFFRY